MRGVRGYGNLMLIYDPLLLLLFPLTSVAFFLHQRDGDESIQKRRQSRMLAWMFAIWSVVFDGNTIVQWIISPKNRHIVVPDFADGSTTSLIAWGALGALILFIIGCLVDIVTRLRAMRQPDFVRGAPLGVPEGLLPLIVPVQALLARWRRRADTPR